MCHTCDAGHTVPDGVHDAPTEWTMRCGAGGAFIHSEQVTCAIQRSAQCRSANAEHPRGEVWHSKTVTYGLPMRFQRRRQSRRRQITPCGLRDGRPSPSPGKVQAYLLRGTFLFPSFATESASIVRVLRTSGSMATHTQVSPWAAPPSQAHVQRVVSLRPSFLPSGVLWNSARCRRATR